MKTSAEIIKAVFEHSKCVKKNKFAEFLGIEVTTLSNWFAGQPFNMKLVAEKFPEVSAEFLLRGEEPLLKPRSSVNVRNRDGSVAYNGTVTGTPPKVIAQLEKQLNYTQTIINNLQHNIDVIQAQLIEKDAIIQEKSQQLEEKNNQLIGLYQKLLEK